MPLTNGTPRALTTKPQREMIHVGIHCLCDGDNYTMTGIDRVSQAVVRDGANTEVGRDLARITDTFPITAFPAGVQTALGNFINAIDGKASP